MFPEKSFSEQEVGCVEICFYFLEEGWEPELKGIAYAKHIQCEKPDIVSYS